MWRRTERELLIYEAWGEMGGLFSRTNERKESKRKGREGGRKRLGMGLVEERRHLAEREE